MSTISSDYSKAFGQVEAYVGAQIVQRELSNQKTANKPNDDYQAWQTKQTKESEQEEDPDAPDPVPDVISTGASIQNPGSMA